VILQYKRNRVWELFRLFGKVAFFFWGTRNIRT